MIPPHSFMIGRVPGRRLNSCLTQSMSKWNKRESQRGVWLHLRWPSAYLHRPLAAPVPRRLSLFRYGADYVWMLSLSRKDCCCILQQKEQHSAAAAAVGRSVIGLPALGSARHQVEWTGLGRRAFCALCAAADLRCKRLLGRTGTPCGHFTPDAAPPLSLYFSHTSPTAPPTRHCTPSHVPAELCLHSSVSGAVLAGGYWDHYRAWREFQRFTQAHDTLAITLFPGTNNKKTNCCHFPILDSVKK